MARGYNDDPYVETDRNVTYHFQTNARGIVENASKFWGYLRLDFDIVDLVGNDGQVTVMVRGKKECMWEWLRDSGLCKDRLLFEDMVK